MVQDKLSQVMHTAGETAASLGLGGARVNVVLALDVSPAMVPLYGAKAVQALLSPLCALAKSFGEGAIPAFAFGEHVRPLRNLHADDHDGFVEREVIKSGADYQASCRLAPLMNVVARQLFPDEWDLPAQTELVGRVVKREQRVYPKLQAKRAAPLVCIIVTGGAYDDESLTAEAIRRSSHLPIFWQLVGLAAAPLTTDYDLLKRLKSRGDGHVDNVGFSAPSDARPTDALFRGLLAGVSAWLCQGEVRAMLSPDGLDRPAQRPLKRKVTEKLDLPAAPPPTRAPEPKRRVISELHDRIHGPKEMPAEPAPKADAQERLAARLARIEAQLAAPAPEPGEVKASGARRPARTLPIDRLPEDPAAPRSARPRPART